VRHVCFSSHDTAENVINGGADVLLEPLRQEVARRCGSWVDIEGTRIVVADLGEDASLLGVARLIFEG
jgi:hypothetical protein